MQEDMELERVLGILKLLDQVEKVSDNLQESREKLGG